MFYVPKASKNSFIDSEVEWEDKSMTKIEKINKQKIKDLKVIQTIHPHRVSMTVWYQNWSQTKV